ncbi:hypothetical protein ACFQS1_05555 [Paractinoplanes rhizophilus]|uniref:Uncharacterized protein n=1 Tax=Paractinoplanes rhizophilus TaxID=1416877 RepID=A0ABW2HPJ9_9ACTN
MIALPPFVPAGSQLTSADLSPATAVTVAGGSGRGMTLRPLALTLVSTVSGSPLLVRRIKVYGFG